MNPTDFTPGQRAVLRRVADLLVKIADFDNLMPGATSSEALIMRVRGMLDTVSDMLAHPDNELIPSTQSLEQVFNACQQVSKAHAEYEKLESWCYSHHQQCPPFDEEIPVIEYRAKLAARIAEYNVYMSA